MGRVYQIVSKELPPNPGMITSAPDLYKSAPDLPKSALDLRKSTLDLPKSALDLRKSAPDLPKSALDLGKSAPDLPKSALDLRKSAPDLRKSAPDLPKSALDLPKSAPGSFDFKQQFSGFMAKLVNYTPRGGKNGLRYKEIYYGQKMEIIHGSVCGNIIRHIAACGRQAHQNYADQNIRADTPESSASGGEVPQAAVIKDGLEVSQNNAARSEREVIAWLRGLGMVR
jgi:hypothetical protein